MALSNVERQRLWYQRTRLVKQHGIDRELAKSIVVSNKDLGEKLADLFEKLPSFRSLTISLLTSNGV